MGSPDRSVDLLGRTRECNQLDQLVDALRRGESAALVISGEAGVGKTALLDHLCHGASACQVVRATGVESEMELVFAGLHQVCGPFLDKLERLPVPQQEALRIAFGMQLGDAPSAFLLGLATLTLLSEAANERPLVCVVDDAQWVDRASLQTLAFVARRLAADPVALVFALRGPADDHGLGAVPELVLEGLADQHARALLRSTVTGLLDERVRDRIVAETRGNPLALVELTRGLSAEQLPGGIGTTGGRALPSRVEASYQHRIETLPDDVRRLLVLAAAEPTGDPVLLWSAAKRRGIGLAAADAVQSDGLLSIEERVTFRHPLARSAAYRSSSDEDRRAAHRALAEVTDRDADPDRWAAHLAAASDGPDDLVALELERCADRARARGGLAAGAPFLRRSVALTRDRGQRTVRALRAAEASLEAGAFDATHDMLVVAELGDLDELQRARVDLVRADASYSRSRGGDAPTLLLRAARTLEPLDPELARGTYLDAWSAALFAGPLAAAGGGLVDVSRRALAAPSARDDPRPSEVLLEGLSLAMTADRDVAAPVLRHAAEAFVGDEVTAEEMLRWGWLATAAAAMVWDLDTALTVAGRSVLAARRSGALAVLAVDLNVDAQLSALSGDLDGAATLVAEATVVTDATGAHVVPFGAMLVAALRGSEADLVPLADAGIRQATALGQGVAVQHARWATSILRNGQGRYDEAFTAARATCEDTPELFVATWAASELVEAAVVAGDLDLARETLDWLTLATTAAGTDLASGLEARNRALLATGGTAESSFHEAIGLLARGPARPDLARAHLLYGEWLGRQGRGDDAGEQLRTAHDLFLTCRMGAFEERARAGLARHGVRVQGSRDRPSVALTAKETQIARLAAAGGSNAEIGAQLYVSARTVEWHLHKVFLKLGITARLELGAALETAAVPPI